MINKIWKPVFVACTIGCLASCSDQMDYNEYNIYDKDYITQNFANVGGFMTDIYNTVDYDFGNYSSGAMQASATDESEYSILGNGIEDFYNGAWSPTNAKNGIWNSMYAGIKTCNHVIHELQGLTFDELKLNSDYAAQLHRYENYKYESRFMRAYFYFCLVRQYGDVPLVTTEISAEEANAVKRTAADEVFKFILDECNEIQSKITEDYSDLGQFATGTEETGRADKLAVLALKARAALYWASPLFNQIGDKERYKTAALYTKELLEAAENRGKGLTANYADLWAAASFNTASIMKEILFGRRYGSAGSAGDNLVETNNYPAGIEGGAGGNCPTQNLVDAYDMINGKSINEAGSGYDEQNPYKDRDPRLAATVAVNGDQWPTYSGAAKIETFQGGINGEPLTGATPTGYYLKKLCNGAISLASNSKFTASRHTWLTFRMGEFYLNYAEAVFKYLGSADATSAEFPMSAREAASKTRERAGMPAFDAGMDATTFWTKLCNERFVELAFEGHRFWDVRRWKEADKYFKNIVEMKLTKEADGTITYTRKNVTRQWNDKMYLFPIPQAELLKNSNLTQNAGW
ncbi:MAG: RagB/SusD family nutrient uptake outer membrane protein [Bacteroidaceae bacterium]|nr:RagB/SusD family nutrient uptake outer membrane protein [Bacteroidaceae bacterium]